MPPEHSAASRPPAWSQVKQLPHHCGESQEGLRGLATPTKSGQAGGQCQPPATRSCNLFWGTSFGSARAARQVGASLQGFLQTHPPVTFCGLWGIWFTTPAAYCAAWALWQCLAGEPWLTNCPPAHRMVGLRFSQGLGHHRVKSMLPSLSLISWAHVPQHVACGCGKTWVVRWREQTYLKLF